MRRFLRSGSAALALALALSGSAQAGQLREPASSGRVSLIENFQEWLRSLGPHPGGLGGLWEEEGSIMDPDGRPTGSSQEPGSDAGSIMDPDG
jgi:hypothetical protein